LLSEYKSEVLPANQVINFVFSLIQEIKLGSKVLEFISACYTSSNKSTMFCTPTRLAISTLFFISLLFS